MQNVIMSDQIAERGIAILENARHETAGRHRCIRLNLQFIRS